MSWSKTSSCASCGNPKACSVHIHRVWVFFVSMLYDIVWWNIATKAHDIVAVQDEHLWELLKIQWHRHAFWGTWGLERMKGHLSPNRGWSMSVGKDREGAADVLGFLASGSKIGLQSQVLFSTGLSMVENDIMSCPRRAAKTEDSATTVPCRDNFLSCLGKFK